MPRTLFAFVISCFAVLFGSFAFVFPLDAQTSATAAPPSVAGTWDGAIDVPGEKLEVSLHFLQAAPGDTAITGTIDIPAQSTQDHKLIRIRRTPDSLYCEMEAVPGRPRFRGVVSADGSTYSGTFVQGGGKIPFELKHSSAKSGTASEAATLDSLRAFYNRALKDWNVPGMSVAIVRNGKVLLTEGFGYRDAEKKLPVTANTLFAIGSSTKAFTSAIMSSLVADGVVEWDKPVRSYIPTFQLKDPVTTSQMTIRDLLTHVSGLPRHDLVWYGSTLSRQELFDRLQFLEPTAPLHQRWQYQNLMYMTAGLLEEKVSGKTWETLVRERIFEPLGMTSSTTSIDTMIASADRAIGYGEKEDKKQEDKKQEDKKKDDKKNEDKAGSGPASKKEKQLEALPYRHFDAMGPAGSINSNAIDMAKWIALNIGEGKYMGREVLDGAALREVHRPQVVIGDHPGAPEIVFDLYGMGWMLHAFRGMKLLEHGGNIDGFSASVSYLPKEKIGVVVLTNMNGTPLPNLVMYQTYDRLLGHSEKDWSAYVLAKMAEADSSAREADAKGSAKKKHEDAARVPNTHPSHPLASYAGEFENPAYGTIVVAASNNGLTAKFREFDMKLSHYHYDVFEGKDTTHDMEIRAQFQTDIKGEIVSVAVPLEPEVDPIVFTRRASSALSDTNYLSRFTGLYELGGMDITIARSGRRLLMTVPGQPTYSLIPTKENEFDLKQLKGFSVRFITKDGAITSVLSIQPNGTFEAHRK